MWPSAFVIFFFVVVLLSAENSKVTVSSSGSLASGETAWDSVRCVCQPHITINPPVCGRPFPSRPGTGCNNSAYQDRVTSELRDTKQHIEELLVAVSDHQDVVSSELRHTTHHLADSRRKVEQLQVTVSDNQEELSSELRNTTHQLADTRRKVEELQVTVSDNQKLVSSELVDIRHQLDKLQVAVFGIVRLLNNAYGTLPKDCTEVLARGVNISGVYTARPLDSGEPIQVYCDMETDGGGWTVFQRRRDGSVDFYRNFANYSQGFGKLDGEFWLGNDNLHRLTAQGEYELRVDISDFENDTAYAVYDSFSIADVNDNYRLSVGDYSGTAGDSLSYNNNLAFSTKDHDNSYNNCARVSHGAWWYDFCSSCNLNGEYIEGESSIKVVTWRHWKMSWDSLKTSEMKLRMK